MKASHSVVHYPSWGSEPDPSMGQLQVIPGAHTQLWVESYFWVGKIGVWSFTFFAVIIPKQNGKLSSKV